MQRSQMKLLSRALQIYRFSKDTLLNADSFYIKYIISNLIWKFQGKTKAIAYLKKNLTTLHLKNGIKWDIEWMSIYLSLVMDKEYLLFNDFLPSEGTFIDVGANVGLYSLLLTLKSRKKARIIAVEANPDTYKILKKNIERNKLNNISAVNAAISTTNGQAKMYFAGKSASDSLLDKGRGHYYVKGITLKEIMSPYKTIDLVKMDIEGAESEIIKASESSLAKIKRFIVETHNFENYTTCIQMFLNNDFTVRDTFHADQKNRVILYAENNRFFPKKSKKKYNGFLFDYTPIKDINFIKK